MAQPRTHALGELPQAHEPAGGRGPQEVRVEDGLIRGRPVRVDYDPLHGAGVVRREKLGRQVFFEVDGASVVERLEEILARFRRIVPLCCPPDAD